MAKGGENQPFLCIASEYVMQYYLLGEELGPIYWNLKYTSLPGGKLLGEFILQITSCGCEMTPDKDVLEKQLPAKLLQRSQVIQ